MELVIMLLLILGACIPAALTLCCLRTLAVISKNVGQGVTIKIALETPPPVEYTAVPEQPTEADKKVMDVAQSIQAFFLDEAQMFKDTEVK